jgi:carboxylate-amine ligase
MEFSGEILQQAVERYGVLSNRAAPTMGVEEEFFLVHPVNRTLQPASARVLTRAATSLGDLIATEFTQYQIEVKTPPRTDW